MAIHLKKCSWSNCGKKEILCLALSNCFSFFIFLAFLEHIPILVQVTIILFNSFPKLSELWYRLKFEAEFMQFRICDHFNGNSQARIVRKQYFLLLILYIQYSCSFPPCLKHYKNQLTRNCVPDVKDLWYITIWVLQQVRLSERVFWCCIDHPIIMCL